MLRSFMFQKRRKGQGLVEYALILSLVAIIVVAVVALFGGTLADTYCGITYTLSPGTQSNGACTKPIVTCNVESNSAAAFSMEARVIDPDVAVPSQAGNYNGNVTVRFYVNGVVYGSAAEQIYKYCFPGGGDGGTPCSTTTVNSGDRIRAVATDNTGKTGQCQVTVP